MRHIRPFPSAVAILLSVGFKPTATATATAVPTATATADVTAPAGDAANADSPSSISTPPPPPVAAAPPPPPRRLVLKHRNVAPLVVVGSGVRKWLSPGVAMQRQRDRLKVERGVELVSLLLLLFWCRLVC